MSEIPLFPLNIFLLPGDYSQLYIFEDRYKQLVHEVRSGKQHFGIPYTSRLNTKNFGTLVELVEVVKEYPAGEMDIIIRAVGTFQLNKYFFQKPGYLFPGGKVHILETPVDAPAGKKLLADFRAYLLQSDEFDSDWLSRTDIALFEIANALQMNDLEKMELLNLQEQARMENFLINYLRYLQLLRDQEAHVYDNIYLN